MPKFYQCGVEFCSRLKTVFFRFRTDKTAAALSLDWSCHGDRVAVAVGYHSGLVAMYDLTTESPLLVAMDTRTLSPYRTILAHLREVTRVRCSVNNPDVIVTGGVDQRLRIW